MLQPIICNHSFFKFSFGVFAKAEYFCARISNRRSWLLLLVQPGLNTPAAGVKPCGTYWAHRDFLFLACAWIIEFKNLTLENESQK
jgi:hypothetical protein